LQAPIFDGLSFFLFALLDDSLCPVKVGDSSCDVVRAFVIALMSMMFDKRFDLLLTTGQR
jgi:hypothetical protein